MVGRGILLFPVVAALAAWCAACGGEAPPPPRPQDPFAYDRARPLQPVAKDVWRNKTLAVERVTYSAADGERVPALLALPRGRRAQGCLIYQGGAGTEKESTAPLWPGLADLGLATFTIDPRYTGARATKAKPLARVVRDPDGIVSMLHDDVVDLRRAIDYLEGRP